MPLSNTAIRSARPGARPVKLSDGGGLFLLLTPTGSRLWRLKYRFAGKEKLLALGTYPTVTLKDARDGREEARKKLAAGYDPGEARKAQKRTEKEQATNSFEVVAREWFQLTKGKWEAEYAKLIMHRLERDMFPSLAKRPINEIAAVELLTALRKIEKRGPSTRHLGRCRSVDRFSGMQW